MQNSVDDDDAALPADSVAHSMNVFLACGSLSILSTTLMGWVLWRNPTMRQHPGVILVWATACDAGFGLKFFLDALFWKAQGGSASLRDYSFNVLDDGCFTAATWGQFFGISSISWNVVWMVNLMHELYAPLVSTRPLLKYYHAYVWVLSALTTLWAMVAGHYGESIDHSCWVANAYPGTAMVCFDMWLTLYTSFALVSLAQGVRWLWFGSTLSRLSRRRRIRHHFLYVVSFLVTWGYILVDRVVLPDGTQNDPAFESFCLSIQPFLMVVIRLSDPSLREGESSASFSGLQEPLLTPDGDYEPPKQITLSSAGSATSGESSSPPRSPSRLLQRTESTASTLSGWGISRDLRLELGVYMLQGLRVALSGDPDSQGRSDSTASDVLRAGASVAAFADGLAAPPVDALAALAARMRAEVRTGTKMWRARPVRGAFTGATATAWLDAQARDKGESRALLRALLDADYCHQAGREGVAPGALASSRLVLAWTEPAERQVHTIVTKFGDAPVGQPFRFTVHAPELFERVRALCGVDCAELLEELSPHLLVVEALKVHFSDGKSASFFCRSASLRYVVKTIDVSEIAPIQAVLGDYVEHFLRNPRSMLVPILGCFSITFRQKKPVHFLVMGDVLGRGPFEHVFDLKGSTLGRTADKGAGTLKDGDFAALRPQGLRLSAPQRAELLMQLTADVRLLQRHRLMDYSLLVGVRSDASSTDAGSSGGSDAGSSGGSDAGASADGAVAASFGEDESQFRLRAHTLAGEPLDETYHLGVIDLLQVFDIKKKVESGLKMVKHADPRADVSAVEPQRYAQRFMEFVESVTGGNVL